MSYIKHDDLPDVYKKAVRFIHTHLIAGTGGLLLYPAMSIIFRPFILFTPVCVGIHTYGIHYMYSSLRHRVNDDFDPKCQYKRFHFSNNGDLIMDPSSVFSWKLRDPVRHTYPIAKDPIANDRIANDRISYVDLSPEQQNIVDKIMERRRDRFRCNLLGFITAWSFMAMWSRIVMCEITGYEFLAAWGMMLPLRLMSDHIFNPVTYYTDQLFGTLDQNLINRFPIANKVYVGMYGDIVFTKNPTLRYFKQINKNENELFY